MKYIIILLALLISSHAYSGKVIYKSEIVIPKGEILSFGYSSGSMYQVMKYDSTIYICRIKDNGKTSCKELKYD